MEWEKNTAAPEGNTATETAPVKKDDAVIRICDLTKKYGAKKAVNKISFDVKRGEILGFLGPNGAGKSTTMNIITGYISATSGSVEVDGIDILESPKEARKKIGYLPENPPLYLDMTVSEYLNFVYELKKVREPRKEHIDGIMQVVKITHVADRMIRNLSKGYKQRVGLAQALIGNPDVLILDEPTVGLDPRQIMEIRDVICELGRERTVILSTHILQEVMAVCDSYTIINKGRIAASGKMDEFSGVASDSCRLRIKADAETTAEIAKTIDGVEKIRSLGSMERDTCDFILTAKSGCDIREGIFNAYSAAGCPILSMSTYFHTLEEVFMRAISSDAEGEENISLKEEAAE